MVRPLLVWPNNQAFTTALDGESSPVDNTDRKGSSRFTWSNSARPIPERPVKHPGSNRFLSVVPKHWNDPPESLAQAMD